MILWIVWKTVSQVGKAIAMYDFVAENPEELGVKAGTLVLIVDKRQGDEWWEVQLPQGRRGLVPASYLQEQR